MIDLGRVNVVLEEDVEELLRNHIKKKGDISRIINEALRQYFARM